MIIENFINLSIYSKLLILLQYAEYNNLSFNIYIINNIYVYTT